ncbi:proline racemase family protein [Undibacterium sp. Jales W-56]|uniref:proline racemase family protein n=1 Tax=Undibacterium sp. Jales W-56 TaxID=2897325 RepID=UPI0021D10AAE|nr:proline racemase family protein [Undibacterium sp. Jales W-56]MCU6432712.1 proline racemase family protein [Undibacterium sp. Jales W-56]
MKKILIIDSHTGGEPTRLIVDGGPDLGDGPLTERLARFKAEFDHYRSATVCEPRGSDVIVGALACAPHDSSCAVGVIFFNNVGYLGMCGHGMIGFVVSLAYQNKIGIGPHRIETPVGIVSVELHADHSVTVHNVPARRYRHAVTLEVDGIGRVVGDIAWGGNWFFLIAGHGLQLDPSNIDTLSDYCWRVRQALEAQGIAGEHAALIDHIELFAPPASSQNHSRNFVLCPGKAYDRSPCGTGTSAKLACLAADGKLAEGDIWRQESIIGSVFEASYKRTGSTLQADEIRPSIRGRAYVNAEATLLLDEADPFVWGIR